MLLEFYRYPAEHWIHLRTTNPIETTFATVRLRTKVTKGPGSRAAGLAMAYKLIEAAQARWRAVNAPHLVALVRNGAVFHKGKLLERPTDITPPEPDESPKRRSPKTPPSTGFDKIPKAGPTQRLTVRSDSGCPGSDRTRTHDRTADQSTHGERQGSPTSRSRCSLVDMSPYAARPHGKS